MYYVLEDFFVDVYSKLISRERPKDYIFSALLSSGLIFYPVVADNNFEAILYPSVQKKKHGVNFAIRNELILEKYNLIGVETRFILDEYENLDPTTEEVTTDQLIGSFGTKAFDFENGKILYDEEGADKLFKLFRELQIGEGKQTRFEQEGVPKNITFNLTPKDLKADKKIVSNRKIGRNERVNVVYQNGERKDYIKYKKVKSDIEQKRCRLTKY